MASGTWKDPARWSSSRRSCCRESPRKRSLRVPGWSLCGCGNSPGAVWSASLARLAFDVFHARAWEGSYSHSGVVSLVDCEIPPHLRFVSAALSFNVVSLNLDGLRYAL